MGPPPTPDWLLAFGAPGTLSDPVIDEETGKPKKDDRGRIQSRRVPRPPLAVGHLVLLTGLAQRLLSLDAELLRANPEHKPKAVPTVTRLAEKAIREQLSHAKLRASCTRAEERLVRRWRRNSEDPSNGDEASAAVPTSRRNGRVLTRRGPKIVIDLSAVPTASPEDLVELRSVLADVVAQLREAAA